MSLTNRTVGDLEIRCLGRLVCSMPQLRMENGCAEKIEIYDLQISTKREFRFCTLATDRHGVHPRKLNWMKLQVSHDTND